jgi:predicted alpha/beta-fold hydrolase
VRRSEVRLFFCMHSGDPVPHDGTFMNYKAPWWLPGGDLQTVWGALYARRRSGPAVTFQRERWVTPDMDFLDVDLADAAELCVDPAASPERRPLLVLFHGLEGSSASHYAQAFGDFARQRGMVYAVPHFRGCSGEMNLAPRAYHSGDFEEVGWILERLRARHHGPIVAVGVSLGGNALLRWAEEMGAAAARVVSAVAAVSAPLDLMVGGLALGKGLNRVVYTNMFLRSMKPKALKKLQQFPGLFDRDTLLAVRDLYAFDNVFTAPLHGYRNTDDYWTRASAKPHLARIRVPALVVNARNDPFVPTASLPGLRDVGTHVTLWQPAQGGHVGFPAGRWPAHVRTMPEAVGSWLLSASR